jgi:hypothetical protein
MATEKGKSVTDWESAVDSSTLNVFYRTLNMEGLEIFYREAGPRAVHYGCNANAIPRWHFEEYSSPGVR